MKNELLLRGVKLDDGRFVIKSGEGEIIGYMGGGSGGRTKTKELLWTNPNPTDPIVGDDDSELVVDINVRNYDYIIIGFADASTGAAVGVSSVVIEDFDVNYLPVAFSAENYDFDLGNEGMLIARRLVEFDDAGKVHFGQAFAAKIIKGDGATNITFITGYSTFDNTGNVAKKTMIPTKIYGVKYN